MIPSLTGIIKLYTQLFNPTCAGDGGIIHLRILDLDSKRPAPHRKTKYFPRIFLPMEIRYWLICPKPVSSLDILDIQTGKLLKRLPSHHLVYTYLSFSDSLVLAAVRNEKGRWH